MLLRMRRPKIVGKSDSSSSSAKYSKQSFKSGRKLLDKSASSTLMKLPKIVERVETECGAELDNISIPIAYTSVFQHFKVIDEQRFQERKKVTSDETKKSLAAVFTPSWRKVNRTETDEEVNDSASAEEDTSDERYLSMHERDLTEQKIRYEAHRNKLKRKRAG